MAISGLVNFFRWALFLWSMMHAVLEEYSSAGVHPSVVEAWIPATNYRQCDTRKETSKFPWRQNTACVQRSVPSAMAASPKTIAMPTSKRKWQVWKTIDRLQEMIDEGTPSERNFSLYPASRELVTEIASILTTLATKHEGKLEWQGLLNKSNMLHEVEESILAIHFLQEQWKTNPIQKFRNVVLVDVCCGKGVFSLLASYFFANHKNSELFIEKIIMLDKDPKLRWDHIEASNKDAATSPDSRPFIECWPRFNLHDVDEVVQRLETQLNTTSSSNSIAELAMVGIHLCKTLSPTCIGIANLLGPQQCPNLILAPCCLPRVVVQSKYNNNQSNTSNKKVLEVKQYETPQQRQEREVAQERRKMAMVRGRGAKSTNDDGTIAMGACWKCGEFGHTKANCPSNQSTSKPSLIKSPTKVLDVSNILQTDQPFGSYCQLLSTSIQLDNVVVQETGLTNNHMLVGAKSKTKQTNKQEANNWNRDRKSMYIVASAKSSNTSD